MRHIRNFEQCVGLTVIYDTIDITISILKIPTLRTAV